MDTAIKYLNSDKEKKYAKRLYEVKRLDKKLRLLINFKLDHY